ncbi:MAG: efflux RND transporter periplasmic adaptor subunit [Candidatus Hydrogenedentes bacterium]|nr:efflux RND transporter periplasmic adaptor subunit [Candidatus Hydrogenedentota bacterium]
MAKQRRLGPKILGWVVIPAVLVGVPAMYLSRESTIDVTAVTVERGRVEQTITAISSGTVMARSTSLVAAGSMGTIMAFPADEGDPVQAGDVLVELRHTELDAQVRLAEANLKVGKSRLEQAKMGKSINSKVSSTRVAQAQAQYEQVKKDFDQAKTLMATNAIPRNLFDKAETAFKVADEALAAALASEGEDAVRGEEVTMAEANVEQLEAAIEVAKAARDNTFVKAPFDGIVAKTTRKVGEAVTIGMPLLQLVNPSDIYIEAPFDEANASQIKVGQKVRINIDAYRGTDFYGTVDFISPVVSLNPDLSRTLNVQVTIEQDKDKFITGMSADVIILVDEKDNVVFAPTESLIRQEFAYIIENGRAVRHDVKTGVGNWNTIEITDGIAEGDQIITSVSNAALKDGVKVQVVEKLGT